MVSEILSDWLLYPVDITSVVYHTILLSLKVEQPPTCASWGDAISMVPPMKYSGQQTGTKSSQSNLQKKI